MEFLTAEDIRLMERLQDVLEQLTVMERAVAELEMGRLPGGLLAAQNRLWQAMARGEGVAEARARFDRLRDLNDELRMRAGERRDDLKAEADRLLGGFSSPAARSFFLSAWRRRGRVVFPPDPRGACGRCRVMLARAQVEALMRGRWVVCPLCEAVLRPDPTRRPNHPTHMC